MFNIDFNFDYNQPIQHDVLYTCKFFGNMEIPLVLTSTKSEKIKQVIKASVFRPLASIRFYKEESMLYFCYCAQNICCIIEVTDMTPIIELLNKIQCYFIIYLDPQDYDFMKSNNINIQPLSETLMTEIKLEVNNIDQGFFIPLNLQPNADKFTFSKYLFITHSIISSFFIRRNYFPIPEFSSAIPVDCPSRSFQQYTSPKYFYYLRPIQTNQVKLCLELQKGYLCVIKDYPDRSVFEKEKARHEEIGWHENIVNCFGFIDDDPSRVQPSLIFEFASNTSLEHLFDTGGQLSDTTKTRIIYQILGGLDFLHMKGIVYQNLVPENVLVNSNYDVLLTHFAGSRKYIDDGKFDVDDGFTFHDDLGLFGIIIFEIIYMKAIWSRKDYPNATSRNRLDYINQNKMPHLGIEIGTIVSLYEKCIRNTLDHRVSTFLYLKEYQQYYYYFYNTELRKLIQKLYTRQITLSPRDGIRKDVQYYVHMSNQNDAASLYTLGLFYQEGAYYSKDVRSAQRKFQQAAEIACSEAIYQLIRSSLIFGISNGFNEKMCLSMLEEYSSEPGNVKAKFLYAKYIIEHQDKFPDQESRTKAINLLISIRNESCDAQTYLGKLMLEGKILSKDVASAKIYFESASKECSSDAVLELANLYETGVENIVEQDPNKALQYYILSASLQNETAVTVLISKYDNLETVNQIKVLQLLKISAKQGITPALKYIGFYQKKLALDKNSTENSQRKERRMFKAILYLTSAAENNDMDSLIEISKQLYFHENVEQDIKKAFNYYEKYKRLGGKEIIKEFENSKSSVVTLKSTKKDRDLTIDFYSGLSFEKGFMSDTIDNFFESGDRDAIFLKTRIMLRDKTAPFPKIIRLLKVSAETNAGAQNELGKIYAYGIGIQQNMDEAIRLFTLSAESGHIEAQYHLGIMTKNKNPQLSLSMLKRSSSNKYLNSLYEMAVYYAKKNEFREAKSYLRSAIIKKHAYSFYLFGILSEKDKTSTENINLFKTAASINCIDAEKKLTELNVKFKLVPGKCLDQNESEKAGHFYECFTCGIINGLKICSFCARTKHSGHALLDLGEVVDSFCCKESPL